MVSRARVIRPCHRGLDPRASIRENKGCGNRFAGSKPAHDDGLGNGENALHFMVIEHFHEAKAVYRRFREKGRMMPEGLTFVSSWVSADLGRCFQVMECEDATLLQSWVAAWSDLADFEIVPVTAGKATAEVLGPML
jgi:hypothetical protein